MSILDVRWQGSAKGVDRPVDAPFLTIERRTAGGGFAPADSDLGLGVIWREADGEYRARYDIPPALPAGTYRTRVTSRGYDLPSEPFEIIPSEDLRPLGVTGRAVPARTSRRRSASSAACARGRARGARSARTAGASARAARRRAGRACAPAR
jgi:hypothetical protein